MPACTGHLCTRTGSRSQTQVALPAITRPFFACPAGWLQQAPAQIGAKPAGTPKFPQALAGLSSPLWCRTCTCTCTPCYLDGALRDPFSSPFEIPSIPRISHFASCILHCILHCIAQHRSSRPFSCSANASVRRVDQSWQSSAELSCA